MIKKLNTFLFVLLLCGVLAPSVAFCAESNARDLRVTAAQPESVTNSISTAEARDLKPLVKKFYNTLQEDVIADYEEQAVILKRVAKCFENENCKRLAEFKKAFKQYRFYSGMWLYPKMKKALYSRSDYYSMNKGAQLYFSINTDGYSDEFKMLRRNYVNFKKERDSTLRGLVRHNRKKREVQRMTLQLNHGRSTFYKKLSMDILSQYPVFGHIVQIDPDYKSFHTAILEYIDDIEEMNENVRNLMDEEKKELIGFTHILNITVKKFTERESDAIASYLSYIQSQDTWYNRIYEIFTSLKTMALVICHTATYAANVPNPIIQAVRLMIGLGCVFYGVGAVLKYTYGATQDILRQLKYAKTHEFSDEILSQYMKIYMVTFVMAALYVVPGIPGIFGRAKGINKYGRISLNMIKKKRMGKGSAQKLFNRKRLQKLFAQDMKTLGKSYGTYYGEEIALDEMLTGTGRYLPTFLFSSAVGHAATRALNRNPEVYVYSDLLMSMKTLVKK